MTVTARQFMSPTSTPIISRMSTTRKSKEKAAAETRPLFRRALLSLVAVPLSWPAIADATRKNTHIPVAITFCDSTSCKQALARIWDGDTFRLEVKGFGRDQDPHSEHRHARNRRTMSGRKSRRPKSQDRACRNHQRQSGLCDLGRPRWLGREIAWLSIGGNDVGEMLVNRGLARPWNGRRLPWC